MERAASVFLRADISEKDARSLITWLGNEHVTRYLNEDAGAADGINRLLESSGGQMLRCFFNRGGSFFMVDASDCGPIGFVRLRDAPAGELEIVVAIGEESIWGQGYGKHAIRRALASAFFEKRASRVIANIHRANRRSIRAFEHVGFSELGRSETTIRYCLTMKQYLDSFKKSNIQ